MNDRPAPTIQKIRATAAMKQVMAEYFTELKEAAASPDERIAWCTSVGPAELLRAFGLHVYFPENHGALLGASRAATDLIPAANAIGYSPDICSYLTSDIGAYLKKQTPLTRAFGLESAPRADLLVYNTNQCRDVHEWFSFYQREWGVPILGIETPRGIGDITEEHVQALVTQYHAMVPTLEEVSGQAFDLDRLREVVASSHRCTQLWKRVLELAQHQPSPLTFFDGTIHMGPAVVLRGDPRAETYYKTLIAELEERIEQGIAAVPDEAHRFYWEGMPVWGKIRDHSETFAGHQACVVASTYCNSWIFEALAHEDPFEGMARAYAEIFIARDEDFKEAYLTRMAEAYHIDGFIFHDAKTCPNNSNNRYGLSKRVSQKLAIPHVVISGDLNDLRMYSEEQTRTQFEALVEQLHEAQG